MRVKSGSAMVITLLLLATVGSISFAIGRLFVLDLAMSRIYDDSVVAYYAAESGIEEGLLRYRFNKNAEVEAGNPSDADSHDRAVRNSLEDYSRDANQLTTVGNSPTASDRVYDFRMYFREKDLCNINLGNNDGDCDLDQDEKWIYIPANESMKFDITQIGKDNFDLYLKPISENDTAIEAKIIATKIRSEEPEEYKMLFISEQLANEGNIKISSGELSISKTGNYYKIDKIVEKIIGSNLIDYGNYDDENKRVELFIKPIAIEGIIKSSGDSGVMIKTNNNGKARRSSIAGLYSTIKSTGHYGNVTRTLKAEIDRQSGTLYDVFDFVLYDY